ncbi:helix-turn-helix transcriptional regulator [Peptacetobacter sp.]|uniref:helix-turn-helix transcriptional regulator n=1 Tax=Peptacetobacter sp. TaxID=2991975 RepID=UPI003AB67BE7
MIKLKQYRENHNLSQSKLSELSGVNLRTIQSYEGGLKDINKAQALTLYKLAKVLDCTIEDLLELPSE